MFNWLKRLRTLKFWQLVMALVVVAGAGAGAYYGANTWLGRSKTTSATVTQTATVGYGNISTTLTVAGSLSYYNIQQITFGAAGTISAVKVAVGDSVTKGEILATFDDASNRALQQALLQAEAALTTAQDNLASAETPYTAADIAQAQAAVTSAQINVNTAQTDLEDAQNPYSAADIAQAEIAVLDAQTAVDTAQDNLDLAETPYTADEIAAQEALVQTDETYYAAVCVKAQGDIYDAQIQLQNAETAYQTALLSGTPAQQAQALTDEQAAQANLTIVQTNAAKAIQAALDAFTQAQDTLVDMQATPDATNIQEKKYELLVAQANLAKAQDNLATMQAAPDATNILLKQQQLTIARNNLAAAQKSLVDKQATPDAVTIQLDQLAVTNAQAALDLAKTQAQNNAIIAPEAGTITTVNIKAGQAITASTDAVEMIDPSVFALTASVDELDITSVAVGQSAAVTVDALTGQTLTGKVGGIATSATTSSGVVSYKVTVLVNAPTGVSLLAGMSSEADITVQEVDHVLEVPNKAIGGTTTNPTVTVMVNGVAQVTSVTLGLSNDSYTEVTQGLKAGDVVVVGTTTTKSSSTSKTTTRTTTRTTITGTISTQFPGGGSFPTDFGGGSIPTGFAPAGG